MKLLNKTSVYYLAFALPAFIICSVLIYYFISSQIRESLDESLWKEKTEVQKKIMEGVAIETLNDDNITITPVANGAIPFTYLFSDTSIYDDDDAEIIPYRLLQAYFEYDKKVYNILLKNSYVESDDLLYSILLPIIILFIGLFIGILLINYRISKKLWSPFYSTINTLKTFQISEQKAAPFASEKIKEFDELNQSLNKMTEQAIRDYSKQKEFTENASHEMQTPLAVINSKIELLIQSRRLGSEEMEIISGIYNSTNRLSHLNKTLLLLAKIENQQFTENTLVDFRNIVIKNIDAFRENASRRNIVINSELVERSFIKIDPTLSDILVSNVLSNAIRHNLDGGTIFVKLGASSLSVSNTGKKIPLSEDLIFERFKKNTDSTESLGLGLSIVKSISKLYSISIHYQFNSGAHIFIFSW